MTAKVTAEQAIRKVVVEKPLATIHIEIYENAPAKAKFEGKFGARMLTLARKALRRSYIERRLELIKEGGK